MITFTNVGSAPWGEDCAQVGSPGYDLRAIKECTHYKEQIAKHYPLPASGRLSVRRLDHDFGGYFEVMAHFDDEDPVSVAWAYGIEDDPLGALKHWDTPPPDDQVSNKE